MKTVHEVSKITGVSIRTLQYYDSIGLLPAADYSRSGYRLYDNASLKALSEIMLLRELEFSLKEIKTLTCGSKYDRERALCEQIEMLKLKREHIDGLIAFAEKLKETGENTVDFSAFDNKKQEEYKKEAQARWGETAAYKEYEQKNGSRSNEKENAVAAGLMNIFKEFGQLTTTDAAGAEAQAAVKKLQEYITANYYTCTNQILAGLGQMYACGGEFTENIDKAGGENTAAFVNEAIAVYVKQN